MILNFTLDLSLRVLYYINIEMREEDHNDKTN